MSAAILMIQGTQSDAGKSLLTAALCRLLARRGIKVAPFKPQNMALNSAVTVDGGEIGRAQALQALACGLEPHTDMNPILLKPNSDRGSQVIILGKSMGNLDARAYHAHKEALRPVVLAAFRRLADRFEAIIVEGAGSPAEINLRDRDLANMGFAEMVDCPVLLAGDIDRGGVFAQLVGTLHLLSPTERARIKGLVINKFRGDPALLAPGLDWLQQETGIPLLGVMPFLSDLQLDAEDSFFDHQAGRKEGEELLRVVVPRWPRLSNHTDLDPLIRHPRVDLRIIAGGEAIPPGDLILLPGSKCVRADLAWLRQQGWEERIRRHLRYGGKVMGICGGYQMLGRWIRDPDGMEGPPGADPGLGLLDLETTITPHKRLTPNQGRLAWAPIPVQGYEIHMGVTTGPDLARPALILAEGPHGALSADEQILGCYLHGLFDHPAGGTALLAWAGLTDGTTAPDIAAARQESLERLADTFEAVMDPVLLRTLLPIF